MPRWVKGIVIAGAVIGTLLGGGFAATFASLVTPAGSMWPTLPVGGRIYANRYAKEPERGVIVVFRYPEKREQSFAKRIVGLPGDVIVTREGGLTINDWKVPRCIVGTSGYDDPLGEGQKHEGVIAVEWLGASAYLVYEEKGAGPLGDESRYVVEPGTYFVVGDNRNNSHDSRVWFGGKGGGVPFADTIGRVRGHDIPELPANARDREKLSAALAECLTKKPAVTSPPAPK